MSILPTTIILVILVLNSAWSKRLFENDPLAYIPFHSLRETYEEVRLLEHSLLGIINLSVPVDLKNSIFWKRIKYSIGI